MAIQSVATPAHAGIEIDKIVDIGLTGLLKILMRHTYKDGADLGELTNVELATVRNQVANVKQASLSGLHILGDLVSSYDEQMGGSIDTNGLGWLTKTLTEAVEQMLEVESSASLELQRRGYDRRGQPLSVGA